MRAWSAAEGEAIDKLVEDNSFYRKVSIPAGMYNNDADINTFGVGATFVSSADVPEDVVYVVVKAVFDDIDAFRKLHPAFANLKEEEMISDSLSAPLHRWRSEVLQGTRLDVDRSTLLIDKERARHYAGPFSFILEDQCGKRK